MPAPLAIKSMLLGQIRQRPGMYIGDSGTFGLAHIVYMLLDATTQGGPTNQGKRLDLVVDGDHLELTGDLGPLPTLEIDEAFRGEGEGKPPFDYEWLTVAALGDPLELESWAPGESWAARVRRGNLERLEPPSKPHASAEGFRIRFQPDRTCFEPGVRLESDRLAVRLRDLAALKPGLRISLNDARTGAEHVHRYPDGLADLLVSSLPRPVILLVPSPRTCDSATSESGAPSVSIRWIGRRGGSGPGSTQSPPSKVDSTSRQCLRVFGEP